MNIPKTKDPVLHLLVDAEDGATIHGAAIKLLHITDQALKDAREALVGIPAGPNDNPPAVPGLISLLAEAKTTKSRAAGALRSKISNGRAQAMSVVDSLKPAFGREWNGAWNEVGFTNGKLLIPDDPTPVLLAMRAFYAKNPTRELKNPNGIDCTAAACQAAADAITKADTECQEAISDLSKAQKAYKVGFEAARTILSDLQSELKQLIADDDPRWLAFGFEMPGHHGSPTVPTNLVVTPSTAGALYVHCNDARRADSYRFKLLDPADPNKVIAEQLVHEPEAMFDHLVTGTNVKVVASAHNATGESQPCAAVAAVVP